MKSKELMPDGSRSSPLDSSSTEQELSWKKPALPLWQNRSFLIYWAGRSLSFLGDAFVIVALPLLVLQATGSVIQMGLVTGTSTTGLILSSFLSGIIVDRFDRFWVMMICDTGRALLYGAIPLVWLLVGPQLWLIYMVVALGACLTMCYSVAYNAAIPHLVEHEQITLANGWLQSSAALAFMLGPVLATLVSSIWGPSVAVGADALSFVVAALSILFILLRPSNRLSLQTNSTATSPLNRQEFLAGIRFLLRQPTLRAVSLLSMLFALLSTGSVDLFIFHLKHDLLLSDNAVGLVFGLGALGGVLGGLLASALRRSLGFGISWLGAMALIGIVSIGTGLTANFWVIVVLVAGFIFGQALLGVNSMALRQQITPDHLLGRVTAAFWTMNTAPGPIGAALFTMLAAQIGTSSVLSLMGVIVLAIATIGAFTSARIQRPESHS
jgi:MFS family permease